VASKKTRVGSEREGRCRNAIKLQSFPSYSFLSKIKTSRRSDDEVKKGGKHQIHMIKHKREASIDK